jgi:hypothetical protein
VVVGGFVRGNDCVGEGGAGGIEDGAFDAESVSAMLLRVREAERTCEEEDGRSDPDWSLVLHVVLFLTAPTLRFGSGGMQCRLSGIAYDNRHAGSVTKADCRPDNVVHPPATGESNDFF